MTFNEQRSLLNLLIIQQLLSAMFYTEEDVVKQFYCSSSLTLKSPTGRLSCGKQLNVSVSL